MLENVEMKEPIKKSEEQSHTLSIKDITAFTSVKIPQTNVGSNQLSTMRNLFTRVNNFF